MITIDGCRHVNGKTGVVLVRSSAISDIGGWEFHPYDGSGAGCIGWMEVEPSSRGRVIAAITNAKLASEPASW